MEKTHLSAIILIISIALLNSGEVFAAKTTRLIKTANDAKVYLVDNNRRVHIPNPAVFEAGGYKWADIKIVSQKEMKNIPDTALIKSPVDAKVYLVKDGARQWIPNEKTFLDAGLKWPDIVVISQAQVDFYNEKEFSPQSVLKIVKPEISVPDESPPVQQADVLGEKTKTPDVAVNNTINPPKSSVLENKPVENIENEKKSDSNYVRPDRIGLQDIGKYTHVSPEFSNWSMSVGKLFEDGEVFLTKLRIDGKESKYDKYIWNSGVLTPYTEADNLLQKNSKGEKIVDIWSDNANNVYFFSNGKKTKIPTLGGFSTAVTGLNESGMAVGRSEVSGGGLDSGESHAFLWYKGKMKDLGTLGGEESAAEAINNKGQVVGYSHDKDKQGYGFIWENGKMKKISADGYDLAYALDINDNGLIIGNLKTNNSKCVLPVCRTDLYIKDGKLNYPEIESEFFDVNNLDEIVGVSEDAYLIDNIWSRYTKEQRSEIADRADAGRGGKLRGHAVLYTDGDVVRLDDLLQDDNIVFTSAKAINDRGEILATGFNYIDSYAHEYLISLPKDIPPTFNFTVDGDNTIFADNEEKPEGYDEDLKYKITWTDADPDDSAKISLYYNYVCSLCNWDARVEDGKLLVKNISEDSKIDSYTWDMSKLLPGTYYLYAEIDDGKIKRRFDSDRLKMVKNKRLNEKNIVDDAVEETPIIISTSTTTVVPIQKSNVTPVN